jgi:hypothetical protein
MNRQRVHEIREELRAGGYKGPTGHCLARDLVADVLDALLEEGEDERAAREAFERDIAREQS